MVIPELKIIEYMEQLEDRIILHVSLPKKEHTCPNCGEERKRVHNQTLIGMKRTQVLLSSTPFAAERRSSKENFKAFCGNSKNLFATSNRRSTGRNIHEMPDAE